MLINCKLSLDEPCYGSCHSIVQSMSRLLKALLAISSLCFLASCTLFSLSVNEQQQYHTQRAIELHDTWRINGRISISNKDENWYAKFKWHQNKDDFTLRFTGPLGETELYISQLRGQTLLKTPSVKRHGSDLEQLILQETGWKFPLKSLKYWSQGQPNPELVSRLEYNKETHLISDIFQAGWHIQYPRRVEVVQAPQQLILLPKKIIVTQEHIKIKIIVTQWQLGEIPNKISVESH